MPEQTERAAEDRALEAAAKTVAEAWRNGATLGEHEVLAILRRHGLRGAEDDRFHIYEDGVLVTGNAPVQDHPDSIGHSIVRRAHTTTEGDG